MSSNVLISLVTFFLLNSSFLFGVTQSQKTDLTLDMQLEINGKVISQPRISLNFSQMGRITKKTNANNKVLSFEIIPTLKEKNMVLLNCKIKTFADDKNAKKTTIANPKIVVAYGKPATISQKQSDGNTIRLTITPFPNQI